MRVTIPLVGLMVAVLAGCSSSADEAREQARLACTYPAPEAPNYDPQRADLALLQELAATAEARAELAASAASLDERWAVLSEASNLLAAAASRILEIRADGGVVADEMTPEVWDQIKYASDAFVVECRPVIG